MTLRCKEDGQSIFSDFYHDFNDNEVNNIRSTYIKKKETDNKYDLLGRRTNDSSMRNKPYIQNGKKYLIK